MPDVSINIRISSGIAQWFMTALCLCLMSVEVSPESITLDTYYPAPSGIYVNLIATQQTILARDSGNVGIANNSPTEKLDIENSSTGNGIRIGNSGGDSVSFYDDGSAHIEGSANSNLLINGINNTATILGTGGGNVGIGTYNPGQLVEINGNAQVDKNIIANPSGCSLLNVCASGPNSATTVDTCPNGQYATWTPGVKPNGQVSASPPNLVYFNGGNTPEAYSGCVPAEVYCCPN